MSTFFVRLGNLISHNQSYIAIVLTIVTLALAGAITWGQVLTGFGIFYVIFLVIAVLRHVTKRKS